MGSGVGVGGLGQYLWERKVCGCQKEARGTGEMGSKRGSGGKRDALGMGSQSWGREEGWLAWVARSGCGAGEWTRRSSQAQGGSGNGRQGS